MKILWFSQRQTLYKNFMNPENNLPEAEIIVPNGSMNVIL